MKERNTKIMPTFMLVCTLLLFIGLCTSILVDRYLDTKDENVKSMYPYGDAQEYYEQGEYDKLNPLVKKYKKDFTDYERGVYQQIGDIYEEYNIYKEYRNKVLSQGFLSLEDYEVNSMAQSIYDVLNPYTYKQPSLYEENREIVEAWQEEIKTFLYYGLDEYCFEKEDIDFFILDGYESMYQNDGRESSQFVELFEQKWEEVNTDERDS